MEEYRVIEDYPNYSVSNLGNIKNNRTGTVLKQATNKSGYKLVNVKPDGRGKGKTFRVHREVAKAFIENPLDKPCVNHLDGVKYNNVEDNLEWVTHKENSLHSTKVLGNVFPQKRLRKLDESQVEYILKVYKSGCRDKGGRALSRLMGVDRSVIENIVSNKGYFKKA